MNNWQCIVDSHHDISTVCDNVKQLLLEKNMKYGDSALNPIRVLSKAGPSEQILVRIDDKLNRVKQGDILQDDEDVIMDLIGYFVLLKIALERRDVNHPIMNNTWTFDYVLVPRDSFDSKELRTINQSILIKPGKRLRSMSVMKNILVEAEVTEEFDQEIAIYDLNQFLNCLSLIPGAELDVNHGSYHTGWRR